MNLAIDMILTELPCRSNLDRVRLFLCTQMTSQNIDIGTHLFESRNLETTSHISLNAKLSHSCKKKLFFLFTIFYKFMPFVLFMADCQQQGF
jgi:hypothetical protein